MTRNNGAAIRGTSLRTKILIPFFAILIALGSTATIGTIFIISNTLEQTADERLNAFQQKVYTEIRNLEATLLRQSELHELHFLMDEVYATYKVSELEKIEKLIDRNLSEGNISSCYISPDDIDGNPDEELSRLLNLARISRKPQIRFMSELGPSPALTVLRPVISNDRVVQYILLQAVIDTTWLHEISAPLNVRTALFDLQGQFLIGSSDKKNFVKPTREIMQQVLNGEKVFMSQGSFLRDRNLFYPIPLGTTDMLIVLLDMPLTDISSLVSTLATRSAISIFIALLLGGYIYYRLVSQILSPAQKVLTATREISNGNLDYRIEQIPPGEFGQLASSFNTMIEDIHELHENSITKEKELIRAQEELKYTNLLAEKNRAIEETNQELKSHLKEMSTLLQLNQVMASTLELDTLFERVINALSDLLDCEMASLLLYDSKKKELEVTHTLGIDRDTLKDIHFSLNEGVSGEVARSHQTIYVKNLQEDRRYLKYKGALPADGSMLSMPLLFKNRLCGVLNLHRSEIDGFDEDGIKLARAVTNQVAVAVENTRLYEQAKQKSMTDDLTGLANRRHFDDILQREIVHTKRYSTDISMIIADIDHFKKYNDTHGHIQGDIALKKVADLLLQNTRGIDLVARFGGEEFVILLPKTSVAGAKITAEKLRDIIETSEFMGESQSQPDGRLTLSIGIATCPEHTSDVNLLLNLADQALYRAKETGRNRVVIWDASIRN